MDGHQRLIEAAQEYARAVSSGEDVAPARESLAGAIREAALERLKTKIDGALAEDVAQEVVERVLGAFARAATTAPKLPAYVAAAAYNTLRSHLRRGSARRESLTDFADVPREPASEGPNPEEALADAQESSALAAEVRAVVAEAPAAYRDVLTQHFFEGRSVPDIVEAEVTARLISAGLDASDPLGRAKEHDRARDVVYQRLCRAKLWVAQRLPERRGRGRR